MKWSQKGISCPSLNKGWPYIPVGGSPGLSQDTPTSKMSRSCGSYPPAIRKLRKFFYNYLHIYILAFYTFFKITFLYLQYFLTTISSRANFLWSEKKIWNDCSKRYFDFSRITFMFTRGKYHGRLLRHMLWFCRRVIQMNLFSLKQCLV